MGRHDPQAFVLSVFFFPFFFSLEPWWISRGAHWGKSHDAVFALGESVVSMVPMGWICDQKSSSAGSPPLFGSVEVREGLDGFGS